MPGSGGCAYDVPLEEAPGIGDPAKIAAGQQTHADHELHIARWRIHHADDRGATPQVMAWAEQKVRAAWPA